MENNFDLEKAIEKLAQQEKEMFLAFKEVANQWRNGLLIFSGLAIASLGGQTDVCARVIIILWLFEALFILTIFWINRGVYNLIMDRHFEGQVSEEQEQRDLKFSEKKHGQVKILEKITFVLFLLSTLLTIIYFIFL